MLTGKICIVRVLLIKCTCLKINTAQTNTICKSSGLHPLNLQSLYCYPVSHVEASVCINGHVDTR